MGNSPSKGGRPATHDLRRAQKKTAASAGRSHAFPPSQLAAPARRRHHNLPRDLPRKPRFVEDLDSDPDPPPPVDSLAEPPPPPNPRQAPAPFEYEVPAEQGTSYPRPTRVRGPDRQGWLPSGHTPASAGGLQRRGAVRGRQPEQPREKPKKVSPERPAGFGRTTRPTPPPPPTPPSYARDSRIPASSGRGRTPATVPSRASYTASTASYRATTSTSGSGSGPSRVPSAKPVVRRKAVPDPCRYNRRETELMGRARLTEFSKMGLPPPPPLPAEEEAREDEESERAPVIGGLKRQPAVHHRVNTYRPPAERAAAATALKVAAAASRSRSIKTTRPIPRPSK